MASKRTEKWPNEWREWVDLLPADERTVVLLLAAHLDARPLDEREHERHGD